MIQIPGRASPSASAQAATVTPAVQRKLDTLRELNVGPNGLPSNASLMAHAKAKAKGNDLDAAEDALTLTNPFDPGSALWHLETGQRLIELAQSLGKEGERTRTSAVVTRTLQHLDSAAARARDAGDLSSQVAAKTQAAFLHERFRGDPQAAIDNYRAALQLQPNDPSIQEALTRLERSLANLQARGRNGKR